MTIRYRMRAALAGFAATIAPLLFSGPAGAVSDPVGIWTLSMTGTPRSCRLQFRADSAATGQAVAIPPGCRHAFPLLATVRSWSIPDGVHLALNDENGANVLMFDESADGHLEAAAPENNGGTYVLATVGVARRTGAPETASATRVDPQEAAASARVASPAVSPPVTVAATAGHYAVMRGSRDTGCMVTLDDTGGNAQASLKARLAPACRDQGIIIFDPVGWSLKGGHLVLAARKGHTAAFSEDAAGLWIKDGKTGQPLGLKRL